MPVCTFNRTIDLFNIIWVATGESADDRSAGFVSDGLDCSKVTW